MIDISVIIPVYNTEQYLVRCLNSVLSQTYKNIEIIVVNDGSHGNCDEIIYTYKKKHSCIHYICHDNNKSLMQSRITGIRNARGTYLLHLDSDDTISNTTCEKLYKKAICEQADIVQYTVKHGALLNKNKLHFSTYCYDILEHNKILDAFLDYNISWPVCGKFIRRDIFLQSLKLGNTPQELHINQCEDLALFFPVCCLAKKYIYVPECGTYYYFENTGSLTKDLFISDARWEKVCLDFKSVRKLILEVAKKQNFLEHDHIRLEKRLLETFKWLVEEIKERNIAKKGKYYSQLLDAINQGQAVQYVGKQYFDMLCESAVYIQKKCPSIKIRHIAIFIASLKHGGAERVACLLGDIFQSVNFQVTLFVDEQPTNDDFPHKVVSLVLSHDRAARWNQIQTYCVDFDIDLCIFNTHWEIDMLYDLLAAKLVGRIVISIEHNCFFFPLYSGDMPLIAMRDRAYRAADVIVCLSDTQADFWRSAGHKQAVTLPNPLTFSKDTCLRSDGKHNNLLFIGRMCDLKGAKTALHVLAGLIDIIPDIHMFFLGRFINNNYEREFFALAVKLGVSEYIDVKGHIVNISDYYAQSAVHIMPSCIEVWGMSLTEAKSHGVPSVLFSMPYLDYTDEECGSIMIDKEDIDGMVTATARLLTDANYWRSMADKAYACVNKLNNLDILQKWQNIFKLLDDNANIFDVTDTCYKNEPSKLLGIAIHEITSSAAYHNKVIQYKCTKSSSMPKYLLMVQNTVDSLLPPKTKRRKYVYIFCLKLYLIVKYIFKIRKVKGK
jgi:glycosyltransferase involved in cell wall biosynthesis